MKSNYNDTPIVTEGGLYVDCHPAYQPKGTSRFVLNGVERTPDGNESKISNENSALLCANLPSGYFPNGDCYIGDDTIFQISTTIDGRTEMGLVTKDSKYTSLVNSAAVSTKLGARCDIIYRIRRGNSRVVYWVDGENNARSLNIDKLYNYYNTDFQNYLARGGNPDLFIGEKWEQSAFDLIKTYTKIPTFDSVLESETGSILSGSYNFAIQLVDEDLNPTNYITTSNIVRIYNDSTTNPYDRIRGSRNIDTTSQSFPRTNKSIRLTIGNLDTSFPYYRVAIIRAAGNTGEPEKVLLSDLQLTSDSSYLYSGNDSQLQEVKLSDIVVDKEVILAPEHIEQLENRLILASTKTRDINWCDFQPFASKIKSDLATQSILLNNIGSDGNVKNINSTFTLRGYMPGEVHSFAIVYLLDDGTLSPAFHIPGKNSKDTVSHMMYHEIDSKYLPIHTCTGKDYWGKDAMGDNITGKPTRHHRFPFRSDINKPLVTRNTSSSVLTKYRLKVVISLAVGKTYPVDGSGNTLAIPFNFFYEKNGAAANNNYSGILVNTDVSEGRQILLYDNNEQLQTLDGTNYSQLDATSQLNSYQTVGSPTFVITEQYESYTVSSDINTDSAEIFGITFSNIQRPADFVLGAFIVRQELTDDDRIVVDTAIIGAMTKYNQYRSFGLINPKQYYTASNCSGTEVPTKTVQYSDTGMWFFNPEFQYLQKKSQFDSIEVEGIYTETSVNMPTISNVDGRICNTGGSKGVYIDDVQAGTSYNPDVNKKKNKDDDGFDLIAGYRNTNVGFALNNSIDLPDKDNVFYLSPAAYSNYSDKTYYNVSGDNKIGVYVAKSTIPSNLFYNTDNGKNQLIYGSLVKNNTTSYSNFINRPYYKEHNNPLLFGNNDTLNNQKIFNGTAQISSMSFVSSVFYDIVVADRPKKSKLWKIILGAALVVAGIALALPSGGASLGLSVAAATALGLTAISYGVSIAVSGIKFEQFKSMVEVDYEKGLKETISDGGTFECVRETIETEDDTIRWFVDRVSNVYMESNVPFGLRSGLTCGLTDFIDSPAAYDEQGFRSYIVEKLTRIDRDQGSGRLYMGYATSEIYDMNLDYMRFNKEKIFDHLPIEYDCCVKEDNYPLRVWNSQQSFQEELSDNYRVFLPNDYRDIEGVRGAISGLYRINNNLFIHSNEGLWRLPQSHQERVEGEIVSSIGTGDFFSIPPILVQDDGLGTGGTQHKWSKVKTSYGVVFVDELQHIVYLHDGDRLEPISKKGMDTFFKQSFTDFLAKQLFDSKGIEFKLFSKSCHPNGTGYLSAFDKQLNRVIITKRDYSILPDKLDQLVIINNIPLDAPSDQFAYCDEDGQFYLGIDVVALQTRDYFEDRSWTISYSFYGRGKWVSWHNYLPLYYSFSQNSLYSFIGNNIWKHNQEGNFQSFYGRKCQFIAEVVGVENPLIDTQFASMMVQTEGRKWDATTRNYMEDRYAFFSRLMVYNTRQCSGELTLTPLISSNSLWMRNHVKNISGVLYVTKSGKNWFINGFKDFVVDYSEPFLTSDWESIKDRHFIDKVVNTNVIDFNKSWKERENFTDKFVILRLIFDNFDSDINLITNFSVITTQSSSNT